MVYVPLKGYGGQGIQNKKISRWGFRFPTSNEWEYACAAGSRSLFRWGNDTPNFPIPRPDTQESRVWGKL